MITLIKSSKTFVVFYNDIQYTVILEKDRDEEYLDIIENKTGTYLDSDSVLFNEIEKYVNEYVNTY